MKYNIGQKVTFTKDLEVDTGFSKSIIKEGEVGIVKASKNFPSIYLLKSGKELLLNKDDTELVGYDAEGLSDFIYRYLSLWLPLDEMLDNYDITAEQFKETVGEAFDELGFYEGMTRVKSNDG